MVIGGKAILTGEVEVSSSKNAILPILAASLLTDGKVEIKKVPSINDVIIISKLLAEIGTKVKQTGDRLIFSGKSISAHPPYELVRQIRASFLVMGPLLARKGKVRVALPGGCAIGTRPIDLHLKGFHALGAEISLNAGDVIAKTNSGLVDPVKSAVWSKIEFGIQNIAGTISFIGSPSLTAIAPL